MSPFSFWFVFAVFNFKKNAIRKVDQDLSFKNTIYTLKKIFIDELPEHFSIPIFKDQHDTLPLKSIFIV